MPALHGWELEECGLEPWEATRREALVDRVRLRVGSHCKRPRILAARKLDHSAAVRVGTQPFSADGVHEEASTSKFVLVDADQFNAACGP